MIPWPPSKSRGRRNEGKNLQYPDLVLLDVREAWEAERGKIEGSQLADNALDQEIVKTWPRDREIIVYCEHGNRSMQPVQFLRQHGFENTRSLAGGFAVWAFSST